MAPAAETHLTGLLLAGRVSLTQAEELRAESARRAVPLGQVLSERGLASPSEAAAWERGPRPPSRRLRPGSESDPELEAALQDPARRLGRYALLKELGRGAFGVVFRAYDSELQREVAIKQLIARDGESLEVVERRLRRFQIEGQAGAKLNHPHIVRVLEVGSERGRPYLVMDYVRGEDLESLLARGALTPRQIVERLRDVAFALGHAHAAGIVHRDVKPANVIVDLDGRAHLTDFGLARELEGSRGLSQTGQILGTPWFLSPEQAAGRPRDTCPQSDVFALGGVLYFALTGEQPFPAESLIGLVSAITSEEPIPPRELNPQLDPALEAVILKCLRKAPAERYADGAEVGRELKRALAQELEAIKPPERVAPVPRRVLVGALAWGALALGAGAGLALSARADRDAALTQARQAEAELQELAARQTEAERQATLQAARVDPSPADPPQGGSPPTLEGLRELYPRGSGGWLTLTSPAETYSILLSVVPNPTGVALCIVRVRHLTAPYGLRDTHSPLDSQGQPLRPLASSWLGRRFADRTPAGPWVVRTGGLEDASGRPTIEWLEGSLGSAILSEVLEPTADRLNREAPRELVVGLLPAWTIQFEPVLWAGPLAGLATSPTPPQTWSLSDEFRKRVAPHRAQSGVLDPVWVRVLTRNGLHPSAPWDPHLPLALPYPTEVPGAPPSPIGIAVQPREALYAWPGSTPFGQVPEAPPAPLVLALSQTKPLVGSPTWVRISWAGTVCWIKRAGALLLEQSTPRWGFTREVALNLRAQPFYPGEELRPVLGDNPVQGVLPPWHPVLLTAARGGPRSVAPDIAERMRAHPDPKIARDWEESDRDNARWLQVQFGERLLWAPESTDYQRRRYDVPTRRVEGPGGEDRFRWTWLEIGE